MDGPRPYPVYLFINVAFGLSFMLYATISSVSRIQTVGLNPLQLVLVGTALELAALIFEVPTGVLADTYGRRRSVILGFLLIGAGFSFEGALPTFAAGATVISISNQANSLGELAGGPVVGAVGTLASIRAALATAALVLSPALFLYGRAIRHGGVEPGLEAPNDTEKSN